MCCYIFDHRIKINSYPFHCICRVMVRAGYFIFAVFCQYFWSISIWRKAVTISYAFRFITTVNHSNRYIMPVYPVEFIKIIASSFIPKHILQHIAVTDAFSFVCGNYFIFRHIIFKTVNFGYMALPCLNNIKIIHPWLVNIYAVCVYGIHYPAYIRHCVPAPKSKSKIIVNKVWIIRFF